MQPPPYSEKEQGPPGGQPYPPPGGQPYPPPGGQPYPPPGGQPYPPPGGQPYPPPGGQPYPPPGGQHYPPPVDNKGYPPPGAYPPPQGPPPPQGYQQQAHHTTIITQPAPQQIIAVSFGEAPVSCTCPHCKAQVITAISHEPGTMAWIVCCILFFVFWPCMCLPFCISGMQDVIHTCPNCRAQVGAFRR